MIGFIVFGLFVGFVARLILPGRQKIGLLRTLLLGVIGSVIGGVVANLLDTGDVFELNFLGSVVAIASAVALLALAERSGMLESGNRARLERR
jgi:uncharacterized membrane protein YeaQ/YmgE (transglycosylase-associated protein family)